jgi:hypothetical protein
MHDDPGASQASPRKRARAGPLEIAAMTDNRSDEKEQVDLLEVKKLQDLISAAAWLDKDQRAYLVERWLHQIRWWNQRSWEARRYYFRLRSVVVIGAVLSPFLVSVHLADEFDPWLRFAGAIVSLAVAICAGLEALYGWGGIWLEKRRAAELLKVEGWLFLHRAGAYKQLEAPAAFNGFVTNVESQIASEVGEYVTVAEKARNVQASVTPTQAASATSGSAGDRSTTEKGRASDSSGG